LQLFEESAARFLGEGWEALNHTVAFYGIEDAIPSLRVILQPGARFAQCGAFAEVDHDAILAHRDAWANRICGVLATAAGLGTVVTVAAFSDRRLGRLRRPD
jgi:hypothetical protein